MANSSQLTVFNFIIKFSQPRACVHRNRKNTKPISKNEITTTRKKKKTRKETKTTGKTSRDLLEIFIALRSGLVITIVLTANENIKNAKWTGVMILLIDACAFPFAYWIQFYSKFNSTRFDSICSTHFFLICSAIHLW